MKRIAMVVAIVVMAAGACKKAQNANTQSMPADSMKMMAPADTTKHMADTSKAQMAAPPAAPAPAKAPAKAPARRRP